jgi:RNA polymerase sigma-70 factor (ECF subfamily)
MDRPAALDHGTMQEVKPVRRLRAVVNGPRGRDHEPDRDLLARVAKGDEAAFSDLYDLIAPHVYAVVLRVLRDPSQADEVTQEVLVELWRLAPRFDEHRGSVRAWASTVAHRRAVDRVRSTQSARDRDQRDITERTAGPEHDEVAELVEDRLERERVTRALEALTPRQRESIELAYYSAYTYREVAAVLDVPEGTIKTRIRDGLIRLRDELEVSS